ncbi:hypothetical protein LVJ94_33145 [Pendulispora rubella]|uniref:Uncharacterized protein n=1 Tax=Pendulispora rubella TaxID=2741070 RepID=A0ABZ2KUK0_9BACT
MSDLPSHAFLLTSLKQELLILQSHFREGTAQEQGTAAINASAARAKAVASMVVEFVSRDPDDKAAATEVKLRIADVATGGGQGIDRMNEAFQALLERFPHARLL